jgi:hypothetical protein
VYVGQTHRSEIHAGMSGVIVVGDPAEAAAARDVAAVSEVDAVDADAAAAESSEGTAAAVGIVTGAGGLGLGLLLAGLLRRNRAVADEEDDGLNRPAGTPGWAG